MKIPTHFAQRPMETAKLPRAPAWWLSQTGAGEEAKAMAGMGKALTDTGAIIAKWYEQEGNSQLDTQRGLAQDKIGEFERAIYADADAHDAGYKKLKADIKKLKPKNKVGARKFQSWMELQNASWDKMEAEKKIRMIKLNAEGMLYTNLREATKRGERKEISLLLQGGVDDRIITPKQGKQAKDQAFHDIDWYAGEQLANNNPETFLANLGQEGFLENLNPSEKQRLKDEAHSNLNNLRIEAERNRKEQAEIVRKDYVDLIGANKSSLGILRQKKNALDGDDYERFTKYELSKIEDEKKNAEALEKIKDPYNREIYLGIQAGTITIEGQIDEYVKQERISVADAEERKTELREQISGTGGTYATLYTKALDIWRGAVTKKQFDADVIDALTAKQINKDEFDSLMKAGADTLKTAQAEALRRSDTEAGRLIVDYRNEVDWLEAIKAFTEEKERDEAIDERKLQFWYLSKYNQVLRSWLMENPDKIGKDFYQYAEMLKHEYWNTSIDEIRKLKTRKDIELAAKKVIGKQKKQKPTPKELRRQNTREAYETGRKLRYWK